MLRKCCYILGILLLTACQNISCPLDNVVKMTSCLYLNGEEVTMGDTLSVTSTSTSQTLLNRLSSFSRFSLPVHQDPSGEASDTLLLSWRVAAKSEGEPAQLLRDTLFVAHTCDPHFESIDCPASVFHHVFSVTSSHTLIDSVEIINPTLNYDATENLRLHIRALGK